MSYNIEKIRADFPALDIKIHDKYPLIYLDNAATTQKPKQMLDAEYLAYTTRNANIHRGVHTLGRQQKFYLQGGLLKASTWLRVFFVRLKCKLAMK